MANKAQTEPGKWSRSRAITLAKELLKSKSKVRITTLAEQLSALPAAVVKALQSKAGKAAGLTCDKQCVWVDVKGERSTKVVAAEPDGATIKVGVISDLHAGSKYCANGKLTKAIEDMYSQGVRVIMVPGDLLDGIYHHGKYEVSESGLEDQTQKLVSLLPNLPGLVYYAITGNHDQTFAAACGVNVGRYIEDAFRGVGRNDFLFVGQRCGYVDVGGVTINMWHPTGSVGYATSYKLQRKVESYEPGNKPDILLVGHWHKQGYVQCRAVHAFACPSMQFGGSDFGNSLIGDSTVGYIVLTLHTGPRGLESLTATYTNLYRKQTMYKHRDRNLLVPA
jgi:predicted phosphodiesterase